MSSSSSSNQPIAPEFIFNVVFRPHTKHQITKKLAVPTSISYSDFYARVIQLGALDESRPLRIQYLDTEHDFCAISSQKELDEAINFNISPLDCFILLSSDLKSVHTPVENDQPSKPKLIKDTKSLESSNATRPTAPARPCSAKNKFADSGDVANRRNQENCSFPCRSESHQGKGSCSSEASAPCSPNASRPGFFAPWQIFSSFWNAPFFHPHVAHQRHPSPPLQHPHHHPGSCRRRNYGHGHGYGTHPYGYGHRPNPPVDGFSGYSTGYTQGYHHGYYHIPYSPYSSPYPQSGYVSPDPCYFNGYYDSPRFHDASQSCEPRHHHGRRGCHNRPRSPPVPGFLRHLCQFLKYHSSSCNQQQKQETKSTSNPESAIPSSSAPSSESTVGTNTESPTQSNSPGLNHYQHLVDAFLQGNTSQVRNIVSNDPFLKQWSFYIDKMLPSTKFRASYIEDVNYPDKTVFGPIPEKILKVWKLKNTGNTAWPAQTRLKFISGDVLTDPNGSGFIPLEHPVAPGETVDISIELSTPPVLGPCRANFRLTTPDGQVFGPRIWFLFIISDGPCTRPQSCPKLTTLDSELSNEAAFPVSTKDSLEAKEPVSPSESLETKEPVSTKDSLEAEEPVSSD